jgi:ribosomal protein S27E
MTLAHFLDGLRCSLCGALNVLWLDPPRVVVECSECGQTALTFPEIGEEVR